MPSALVAQGEGSDLLTAGLIVLAVITPIAVGLAWRLWDRRGDRD